MARINPLRHTILGKKITAYLPVVETKVDQTIEGYIDIKVNTLTDIDGITAEIYRVIPPSLTETRYSRFGSELYSTYPGALTWSIDEKSTGRQTLFWRFRPDAMTGINPEHGQYYGLEFSVSETGSVGTASTVELGPDVVIQLDNLIDNTGITGTTTESVYQGPQGATGLQGVTGLECPGDVGATGPQGVTGVAGLQGEGETGLQGETGVAGLQGATGLQGETGVAGVGGVGTPYYYHSDLAGVSGSFGPMESFLRVPSDHTEDDDFVNVSNANGSTGLHIGDYITKPNDPALATINPGIWTFELYSYASSTLAGRTPQIRVDLLKYSADGTETLLFTVPAQNITETISSYEISYTQTSAITLNMTDRLVSRVWGVENSTSLGTGVHFVYEGNVNTSFVTTPIGQGTQGETGLQGETGVAGLQGETGVQGETGAQGLSVGETGIVTYVWDGGNSTLTTNSHVSVSVPRSVKIDAWEIYTGETGTVRANLSSGNLSSYPPSFDMSGPTGLVMIGDWTASGNTSGWPGTTGAYCDIFKMSLTDVTNVKHLSIALRYHKL